jgi:hypothetical protein
MKKKSLMNLVPTPEEEKSTLSEQLQNRTRQCRNDSMSHPDIFLAEQFCYT